MKEMSAAALLVETWMSLIIIIIRGMIMSAREEDRCSRSAGDTEAALGGATFRCHSSNTELPGRRPAGNGAMKKACLGPFKVVIFTFPASHDRIRRGISVRPGTVNKQIQYNGYRKLISRSKKAIVFSSK